MRRFFEATRLWRGAGWLRMNGGLRVVLVGVAFYVVELTVLGMQKFALFKSTAWDLGIFNQAFTSTVTGQGFFHYNAELYTNPSGSFFGVHFSPVLLVLVPLYALAPSVGTLLAMQSAALALGAVPVYLLSMYENKNAKISVILSISYLLYFHLQLGNMFDFHAEAFLVAPLLFAIYFMRTHRWGLFSLSIVVALSSIEYAAFLVLALGGAMALFDWREILALCRNSKFATSKVLVPLGTVALGAAWFLLAQVIMRLINPSPPPAFVGGQNWSVLGAGSVGEIPIFAALHPANASQAVLFQFPLKLGYVALLLLPLLFLPLLELRAFFVSLPWLFFAFLSNYPPYYQFGFQYAFFVIPGTFWALILGVRKISLWQTRNRFPRVIDNMPRGLITASLLCWLVFTGTVVPSLLRAQDQHGLYLQRIISMVPPNSSILAQNNLFPEFSNRPNAYVIPILIPAWEPVYPQMLETVFERDPEFILVDSTSDIQASSTAILRAGTSGMYGVYAWADGIMLFRRGFTDKPSFLVPFRALFDHSNLAITSGSVVADPAASGKLIICHSASLNAPGPFRVWLSTHDGLAVPQGAYQLTIRLMSPEKIIDNALTVEILAANATSTLVTFTIPGSDLATAGQWNSFNFDFHLPTPDVISLNALEPTGTAGLYLDSIAISQLSA